MNADNPYYDNRWKILVILGIAQLMVVLDATIVNIALPSAQKALHFTNDRRCCSSAAFRQSRSAASRSSPTDTAISSPSE
jgi:hypothetical protein